MTSPVSASLSLAEFLERLGSRSPSPGGGAVAALSAAMGASQLLMIAEYSNRGPSDEDPRERLRSLAREMAGLAEEDAAAYGAYAAARKARKEDPATYERAKEAIADVPLRLMERSLDALELAAPVLRLAPAWFGGDAGIAAGCLTTGIEGARALCGANLGALLPGSAAVIERRLAEGERRYERCRRTLEPLLLSRLPAR